MESILDASQHFPPSWVLRARRATQTLLLVGGIVFGCASTDAQAAGIVRSVEYVEIVIASGATSNSANLTKNQDVANAVPFASMMANSSANAFGKLFTDVFLTAGAPATVTVQRDLTGGTVTVGVYVVEFDPTLVRVQQGTFSLANGNPSGTAAITTAVDTARAAMLFYARNNAPVGNGYDDVMLQGLFSTASQLQFTRDGTSATINGHWYVFEALNNGGYAFTVQTRTFSGSGALVSSTLTPNVVSSDSLLIGSYRSDETSTFPDAGAYRLFLNCPGACSSIRGTSPTGSGINVTAFVVTFTSGVQVQRGLLNYGVTLQATTGIAAVSLARTMVWNGGTNGPGLMNTDTGTADWQPTAHQRIYLLNTTNVRGDRGQADDVTEGTFEVVQFELAPDDVYFSVGTAAGNLRTGSPLISISGGVATLSVAQTGNVGLGDEIDYDGDNKKVYIKSVVSPTELGVHTNDGSVPADVTNLTVNAIRRTFPSVLTAESQSPTGTYLGTANLTTANVRLNWVVYNDGPLNVGSVRLIDGYTTDATHFVTLTAASGSQVASGLTQRHNGTAGTGARMVATGSIANVLLIQDDYFRVEWLEIDGNGDPGPPLVNSGVHVNGPNVGIVIRDLVVHDVHSNDWAAGIELYRCGGGGATCLVYNNFVYDIQTNGAGIAAPAYGIVDTYGSAGANIGIYNNTVYKIHQVNAADNDAYGITVYDDAGRTVRNNIVIDTAIVGLGVEQDFCAYTGGLPNTETCHAPPATPASAVQNTNMSSDTSATGAGSITGEDTGEFLSVTNGSEDLHLAPTADAIDAAADLIAIFTHDIDGGRREAPWDIGADDRLATTAVELVAFRATARDGRIELEWETGSEIDNLGFHVYRSLTEGGPYARITSRPIPGLGSSPIGASYLFNDSGLSNGSTYFYQLEDIETTGLTEMHGPVSATPMPAASEDGDESDSSTSSGAALITYGEPAANTLRVLKRSSRELVLELVTGGFFAEPQDDGSVRLEVPGFEALSELGELSGPAVPVKRTWVEAVAGRKVKLISVQARGVEAFSSLFPSDAELPEIVATPEGTVNAVEHPRNLRRRARKAFHGEELSPSAAARLVSVGFQGDVKKALVEIAPLRWDESGGQLLLARRLVVRLSFREREPTEQIWADGARGRSYQKRRSHEQRNVVARLLTTQRGLHSVRYEDVMANRRGVPAKTLRLSRQGEPVAFHLEPSRNRFKPGSVLYFVSEGASANPFGGEAVYELEAGMIGEAMAEISVAPSGEPQPVYWHRADWEEDRYHQAALVEAPDLWLWDALFAPEVKRYTIEVSDLAPGSDSSKLSVWLQGVSDFPVDIDHHVRVFVNGSLVEELSWDGKQAKQLEVELAPGLLRDGDNVLELENVGDTQASYSMVMLDRYAVEYPRFALADDGRLEGRWPRSGTAELSGLDAGAHVLDVSETEPRWLVGTQVAGDGRLRFRAESGRSYLVVSPEAVHHPAVAIPRASRLKNTRNRADYLVIAPEAFLHTATPLLELRQGEGLKVKAVSIEEIYSEFGFGEPTPEAVKDFLSFAYHQWRQPSPRYVLVLGDATFDFKDHLQTGVTNQVPPRIVKTSYLWTASDPSYAAVNGDDLLPDLAIGRLPAASVEQARAMVEKILDYETADVGVHRSAVVLVTDNADRAGNFEADADELAAGVLASKNPDKIYLSQLGAAATRSAIVQRFDEGASLVSYLGHGGIHLWADENFFNAGDVASLQPQSQQPVLLTMNCLNGYFHFPYFDSLAEKLVQASDKGAIAAFSPSGLSLNGPANRLHEALLEQIVHSGHERLGDAILAAQESYAETGVFPELLSIYHLLGDPALRLR